MSIMAGVVFSISALMFLFVFWRRLKEDYPSNVIFTSGFLVLVFMIVGVLVTNTFAKPWWFWGAFAGSLVGLLISIFRSKIKTNELLESWINGLVVWMNIFGLVWFFAQPTRDSFLFFVLSLIGLGLFSWFSKHYKRFAWYRSGKVGFAGMATAAAYFAIRALVAIPAYDMIFFPGRVDFVISLLTSAISVLILLKLSKLSRR